MGEHLRLAQKMQTPINATSASTTAITIPASTPLSEQAFRWIAYLHQCWTSIQKPRACNYLRLKRVKKSLLQNNCQWPLRAQRCARGMPSPAVRTAGPMQTFWFWSGGRYVAATRLCVTAIGVGILNTVTELTGRNLREWEACSFFQQGKNSFFARKVLKYEGLFSFWLIDVDWIKLIQFPQETKRGGSLIRFIFAVLLCCSVESERKREQCTPHHVNNHYFGGGRGSLHLNLNGS